MRTSQCPPSRPSQGQGREEVSTYSRYLVGIGGKGEAEGQKGPSHAGGGGTGRLPVDARRLIPGQTDLGARSPDRPIARRHPQSSLERTFGTRLRGLDPWKPWNLSRERAAEQVHYYLVRVVPVLTYTVGTDLGSARARPGSWLHSTHPGAAGGTVLRPCRSRPLPSPFALEWSGHRDFRTTPGGLMHGRTAYCLIYRKGQTMRELRWFGGVVISPSHHQ